MLGESLVLVGGGVESRIEMDVKSCKRRVTSPSEDIIYVFSY